MHWTYAACDTTDLQQGDILAPTVELRRILQEVQPYFCSEKYLGFTVATQSCDLVQRGKHGPRAHHINLAALRSLKAVTPRLIERIIRPFARGVFSVSAKNDARRFLERLLNQNEQALGLFYFHPDADIGLGEPAVAFLRVTFALRAGHYGALLQARTGRLAPPFQAKFGWLLGNLYARAACPDWSDRPGGKEEANRLIGRLLDEPSPGAGPVWIDDAVLAEARSAGVVIHDRDPDELAVEVESHRPPPRLEQIVDEVLREMPKVIEASDEQQRVLRNRLLNNGRLSKLTRV